MYCIVCAQIVSVGETVVDVRHSAIESAMEREGVPRAQRRDCFNKVSTVWHHINRLRMEERKR